MIVNQFLSLASLFLKVSSLYSCPEQKQDLTPIFVVSIENFTYVTSQKIEAASSWWQCRRGRERISSWWWCEFVRLFDNIEL
jgi:hypothetical protein